MKNMILTIILGILLGCTVSLPVTIVKYERYVDTLETEIYQKDKMIDSLSRPSDLTVFETICANKSSKKSDSNE